MKHCYRTLLLLAGLFAAFDSFSRLAHAVSVSSPDKNVQVRCWMKGGEARYSVSYQSEPVMKESRLGLVGINAEAWAKKNRLDLNGFKMKKAVYITDGTEPCLFIQTIFRGISQKKLP